MRGAVSPVTPLSAAAAAADGILTPAISVVSAVEGIQYQVNMSNGECWMTHQLLQQSCP